MNTSFPVDFDSPKNTYYEILYVSRQPSLSSFGAKPLACELNEFVAKHEANMYKRTTLLVRSSFRTGKVVFAFYSVEVEKSLCICGL